ncbi:MAG: ATP-binding protein [Chloroflexi bacterium]|nr:ATP-binding protein [Chloroflexota bacterium]
MSEFVGRTGELETLDDIWASNRSALIVLYGRRRVGKTRLLSHWLQNSGQGQGLYWMAEATAAYDQLSSFAQALAAFETPDIEIPHDLSFPNWEYALQKAAALAKNQRIVLFIDEVTYLMDVNPDFVPILQKAWDHTLSNANVMLALCGSQMGLIQKHLLAHNAPLFGRATVQMNLQPLRFFTTREFFPNYSAIERVIIYSIWGGVPAYWERLNTDLSIPDNLKNLLKPSNTWMLEEAKLLLQDFMNDPHNYVGIMRAIAQGAHTYGEISKRTGLSSGHTSRYLSLLRDTGFVTRRLPVTETNPDSRRGRYYMTDAYLRFHYRFLSQYQSKLALGHQAQLLANIENDLPQFIQQNSWPELCQEWLLSASANNELPVPIEEAGGEWKRKFIIDVTGISKDDKCLALGTCHWGESPPDLTALRDLLALTNSIISQMKGWTVYYVCFSTTKWDTDSQEQALKMVQEKSRRQSWHVAGVRLIHLAEMDDDFYRWSSNR